jgi:hypothetical protein
MCVGAMFRGPHLSRAPRSHPKTGEEVSHAKPFSSTIFSLDRAGVSCRVHCSPDLSSGRTEHPSRARRSAATLQFQDYSPARGSCRYLRRLLGWHLGNSPCLRRPSPIGPFLLAHGASLRCSRSDSRCLVCGRADQGRAVAAAAVPPHHRSRSQRGMGYRDGDTVPPLPSLVPIIPMDLGSLGLRRHRMSGIDPCGSALPGMGPEKVAYIWLRSERGTARAVLRWLRTGRKWASFYGEKAHSRFAAEILAEGVGFEPTLRLPVNTLSKRAP